MQSAAIAAASPASSTSWPSGAFHRFKESFDMAADFSFFVCFPFVGAGRGIAVGFVDCAFGMLAISKNTRSAKYKK